MSEFRTPTTKRHTSRLQDDQELQTPIKIPASPFLLQIGYGCGVNVFSLERSPKVGFTRSPWAIKKRNPQIEQSEKYNERIRFEAEILRKLNHPNIVGFRAFTEVSNGEPCLVMEKLDASLGDKIEERLENGDDPFPAKDILKITYEIVKGLVYLHHTARILHGDMKSFNVLISDDYNRVKICDFGVSVPLTQSLEIDTSKGNFRYVGTDCWSAPEVINENGPITNKADIWAFGLIVWEMIALAPPHVQMDDSLNECCTNESCTNESCTNESCSDASELEMHTTKNIKVNEENDDMEDSIIFLKEMNRYGTRPALPAIHLGKEYQHVLNIFYVCTMPDYKARPSALGIEKYFTKDVYRTK